MPLPAETLSPFSGAGATRNENIEFCRALWRVTTGAPSERRRCQLSFLLFRPSVGTCKWSSKVLLLKAGAFQVQICIILLDFLSLRPLVTIFPWGSPFIHTLCWFSSSLLLFLRRALCRPPFWGGSDVAAFTDASEVKVISAPNDAFTLNDTFQSATPLLGLC